MPRTTAHAASGKGRKAALAMLALVAAFTTGLGVMLVTEHLSRQENRATPNDSPRAAVPATRQPTAIFFGDSYFNGSDPVTAQDTFGPVAGKALGYRVLVRGAGATGFVAARAQPPLIPNYAGQIESGEMNWRGEPPKLVVIEGGLLDRGFPSRGVQQGVDKVLNLARSKFPDAKLILLGPADPFIPASEGVARVEGIMAKASAKAGVPFIRMGDLVSRKELLPLLGEDEVHPTALGYRFLADRLKDELVRLGVQDVARESGALAIGVDSKTAWGRLSDGSRPFSAAIVGDSTADQPTEWGHLAFARLAQVRDRPLVERHWDVARASYSEPVTYNRTGRNAPINLWSGSASGMDGAYSLKYLERLVPTRPDVMVLNHGHNALDVTAKLTSQLEAIVAKSEGLWPRSVAYAVVIQNPRADRWADKFDASLLRERKWAASLPGVLTVDFYCSYLTSGQPLTSLLRDDRVHPNAKGSEMAAAAFEEKVQALPES